MNLKAVVRRRNWSTEGEGSLVKTLYEKLKETQLFSGEYMANAGLTLGVQRVVFAVDKYGLKIFKALKMEVKLHGTLMNLQYHYTSEVYQ